MTVDDVWLISYVPSCVSPVHFMDGLRLVSLLACSAALWLARASRCFAGASCGSGCCVAAFMLRSGALQARLMFFVVFVQPLDALLIRSSIPDSWLAVLDDGSSPT